MLDLKKIEAAINHIAAERGLHREDLIEIIESAIRTAYKKDYGNKDDIVNVKLDFESGDIIVTLEKTVVDEVVDPNTEISKADLGEDADALQIQQAVKESGHGSHPHRGQRGSEWCCLLQSLYPLH